MEDNQQHQIVRIPLLNIRREKSLFAELIIHNAIFTESAIIIDQNANVVTGEIITSSDSCRFIGNTLLWNITRTVSGQVSFKADPVPNCTWNWTTRGIQFQWPKPDRKHPFKLFITINLMNEFYSGVLFSPIPICNDELRQNKADIKDTLFEYATLSPQALLFPRTLSDMTTALNIEYYDEQEELLQRLLFDDNGYIDMAKERRFLNVFKTYAQLRKAMALISQDYFIFEEQDAWNQLTSRKPGTFAIAFSSQQPGLLACHYKSGGLYPETKYVGYFAPAQNLALQNYYYRENGVILCEVVTPPNEGFYQVEEHAPLQEIPIRYSVDDWVRDCVELKYPL